jgi:hypothetical protein
LPRAGVENHYQIIRPLLRMDSMEFYEPIKTFILEMANTRLAQSFFSALVIVFGVSLLPFLKMRFSWKTVLAIALILFGLSGVFVK